MGRVKRIELFDMIVYGIMIFAVIATLYPFINVVAISFSSFKEVLLHPFMIFPRGVSLDAYKVVLSNDLLFSSYFNTIIVTIASSALGIFLTVLSAYPLSKRDLKGRKFFMVFLIITMLFSGGMIPNYLLIRSLHMINTLWALIIPGCIGAFNIILMINFMQTDELASMAEAATIDGAGEPSILMKIVIPTSTASIATILLFYMVAHWNAFFNAVIYINSREKWTLQLLLREIVVSANVRFNSGVVEDINSYVPFMNIKTATLVITILPIICVYPFLQKYFVKGMMLGGVKG